MEIQAPSASEDTWYPFFTPALWRQRREFIWKLLKDKQVTSVIDMGCGEGSVLSSLISCLDEPQIVKLCGLDIDDESLERCKENCKPMENDFRYLRERNLIINIYKGSLSMPYKELLGYDCIILSEVIEHLDLKDLELLPIVLFGNYRCKTIIISTPNADFNVLFPNLKYLTSEATFRDADHKFEWTRKEFEDWCNQQAELFGYKVRFDGVGKTPELKDRHLGYCTQFAIFELNSTITNNEYKKLEFSEHSPELIINYEFPWFDKQVDEKYKIKILKKVKNYFIPIEEKDGGEIFNIERFWEDLEIRQCHRTRINFLNFLKQKECIIEHIIYIDKELVWIKKD